MHHHGRQPVRRRPALGLPELLRQDLGRVQEQDTPGRRATTRPTTRPGPRRYKAYFGSIATPQGKTYYSYDQGNWHFIALDSNYFDQTAQINWLKADLAANTKGCIAAYWHHPLFSSGEHGNDPVSSRSGRSSTTPSADLVLNGHDHHYERFAPQNPDGKADPNGIVEILGGMGGASPYNIENVQPNSQKRLQASTACSS